MLIGPARGRGLVPGGGGRSSADRRAHFKKGRRRVEGLSLVAWCLPRDAESRWNGDLIIGRQDKGLAQGVLAR